MYASVRSVHGICLVAQVPDQVSVTDLGSVSVSVSLGSFGGCMAAKVQYARKTNGQIAKREMSK